MSDDRTVGRPTVRRVKPAGVAKKARYVTKERARQAAIENIHKIGYAVGSTTGKFKVVPVVELNETKAAPEFTVVTVGAGRSREDNLKIAAAAKDLLADLRARRDSLPDGI